MNRRYYIQPDVLISSDLTSHLDCPGMASPSCTTHSATVPTLATRFERRPQCESPRIRYLSLICGPSRLCSEASHSHLQSYKTREDEYCVSTFATSLHQILILYVPPRYPTILIANNDRHYRIKIPSSRVRGRVPQVKKPPSRLTFP